MFFIDKATSEEFLEIYKGVLPEFSGMANHLTTGPCIALEVRQENAVESFREICGPHDPEVARTLRKNSIRAQFGFDRIKNAVHCTDLAEDGPLEVIYFVFGEISNNFFRLNTSSPSYNINKNGASIYTLINHIFYRFLFHKISIHIHNNSLRKSVL